VSLPSSADPTLPKSARRKSLKDIILEFNLVNPKDWATVLEESKKNGKSPEILLLEREIVDRPLLLEAVAKTWKVPTVSLKELTIDPDVVRLLPEALERRHHVIPFRREEENIFVAMADPRDFFVVEDIHLRSGLNVVAHFACVDEIALSLDTAHGRGEEVALSRILDSVKPEEEPQGDLEITSLTLRADIMDVDPGAPEVEKFVHAMILSALNERASDIHIEPFEDPAGKTSRLVVRFRVDGFLAEIPYLKIPWSFRHAIIAKIKIMTATMNITERRLPQSGRIQVVAKGNPIEFRVEVTPTAYGESCVLRVLDRKSVQVDIAKMGFLEDTLTTFLGLFKGVGGKKNFGLILVCGPTGSGKSTTLYAALNHINRPDIKILTAENPVEYNLDGIVQVPINPDLRFSEGRAFDFAGAMRSFLRLDPDVIMIGEIRDLDTAQIAMEAAMTGHLVFSTIHTNDAPSAVARLAEMKVPAFMIASTLKAVLAQRLVRRVCENCKQAFAPAAEEIAIFKTHKVEIPPGTKLSKGKGCKTCNDSGFKGRAGIHELLVLDDDMRDLILKEVSSGPLQTKAVASGMRTLAQDGLAKCLQGITTVREVLGGTEDVK